MLLLLASTETALAATASMRVTAVNDVSAGQAAEVTVFPGDVIELEFLISDWANDVNPVGGYQVTVLPDGYRSGDSGALRPIMFTESLEWFTSCATDADCSTNRCSLFTGLCLPPMCMPGDCSPGFVCDPQRDFCREDDSAIPAPGTRDYGRFIDVDRNDFFFASAEEVLAIATGRVSPAYQYGAIELPPSDSIFDMGDSYYAGSLIVIASVTGSQDGEACGQFELGFASTTQLSFLLFNVTGEVILQSDPATINVACQTGACCDTSTGLCDDFVSQENCSGDANQWTLHMLCSQANCVGPIPTTSEWGLLVLALGLLTCSKMAFRLRKSPNAGLPVTVAART